MAEVVGGPMGLLKRGWLLKGFKFQYERNNLVFEMACFVLLNLLFDMCLAFE